MKIKKYIAALSLTVCAGVTFSATPDLYDPFADACINAEDFRACVSQIEEKNSKEFPGVAKRRGAALCITPEAGSLTCFRNSTKEDENDAYYYYMGQLPHWKNVAVVYSLHWEWSEIRFISTVNGKVLLMMIADSQMSISPDGQYMAFTIEDLERGMYENGAWLYEINDQTEWKKAWGTEGEQNSGFADPRWNGNEQLQVNETAFVESEIKAIGELTITKDAKAEKGWTAVSKKTQK